MKIQTLIAVFAAGALAAVMLGVVAVMLKALFVPQVDNKEIFSLISPAFQTIVGYFVGLLGGHLMRGENK